MALKLGKCRLCLKLGDFYSIFTVDNALQLAEMAMECARVKVSSKNLICSFVWNRLKFGMSTYLISISME